MRVIHIITRLIVGGAQENTVDSVLGLRERSGMEVQLVSGSTVGPEGSLESRLRPFPGLLTILPSLIRPVHPWHDLRALQALTSELRRRRPDLVHTHSGKAGILGRVAARWAGVPRVVHTIHGPSFGSFQGIAANALFTAAERFAARYTTHFVVVADAMKTQYLAAGIGRPEQYTRIFSGFQVDAFANVRNDSGLRARLGLGPQDVVVGKIARLFPLKGHDDLLAVAPALLRSCPRVRFLLVGDGIWRARLESQVKAAGLQGHVVFAGLVRPDEVPAHIGIMDILVHLSRREGLARALAQALAAGKPVVAFDCDGARELCRHGETGFLLPVGDQAGLGQRLGQLAGDAALRDRLGCRGQALVQEWFPVQRMVDELAALYGRLAGDATGPAREGSQAGGSSARAGEGLA